MALRLTVISEQAAALGENATIVIDKDGGTIGRARDNEWVLPDDLRYISSHHARITCRNGGFIVEDTSTNGLYLNDGVDPVGRLGPQPLRPGDHLRLGAYHIEVRDNEAMPAEASAIVSYRAAAGDFEALDLNRDIGAELDINALLVNDPNASAARRAFDPWGNPVADSALLQFDLVQQAAPRTTRPAQPEPPLPRPPGPGATAAAVPAALEAFTRGAGLSGQQLPADAQERLLRLAGLLLREALVGIKELARTQREIRQGAGLCAVGDDPERAALQNLPVEELLVRLLAEPGPQQVDPVQWLRELFALASRHDAALMRALRPALTEFTQRLDPTLLAPGSSGAERFRSITEMLDGRLPHLFGEALARNFNAEIAMGPDPS